MPKIGGAVDNKITYFLPLDILTTCHDIDKGIFSSQWISEDSNSRFIVSFSSSAIPFLFRCIVPTHVTRFSRSHLANRIDVHNGSNEMLRSAKLELVESVSII